MKFIALHSGPTVQWGPEVTAPSGISYTSPYRTTNLWALGDDGHVYALSWDTTQPVGTPPSWVRFTSTGDGKVLP